MEQFQQQFQQMQQELAMAKARGFDLYQQNEQQASYIQKISTLLAQVAQRLGIEDLNKVDPQTILNTLDAALLKPTSDSVSTD